MVSRWAAVAIAAGLMAWGGSAFAQGTKSQEPLPPGAASRAYEKGTKVSPESLRSLSLKVLEVDQKQHTVNFQAKVKPEADITQSGQPIALDQLKPGDEVRASFDPRTGEVIRLEVIKAPR